MTDLIHQLETAAEGSREALIEATIALGIWASERADESARAAEKHYARSLDKQDPNYCLQIGRYNAFLAVRSYAEQSTAAALRAREVERKDG